MWKELQRLINGRHDRIALNIADLHFISADNYAAIASRFTHESERRINLSNVAVSDFWGCGSD
ncbi:hypothetical protein Tcan_10900 [Toxocara canis]|uniref:Uncharacterized protein n=1 Tax=Toxocara canis TaxID=6265 RepID=A0A0B2VTA8_TOXCA|nr:hypothetical protein Tcan_10900 [Toxocara canis]